MAVMKGKGVNSRSTTLCTDPVRAHTHTHRETALGRCGHTERRERGSAHGIKAQVVQSQASPVSDAGKVAAPFRATLNHSAFCEPTLEVCTL